MANPTKLYLVRHGQTDLNRENRFRGYSNTPINRQGRAEALGAAALLSEAGLSRIHTSPMPRSRETAEVIGRATASDVVIDEGLTDVNYGRWQGLTVDEVNERFGDNVIEDWLAETGTFRFPDGDTLEEVRERLTPALLGIVRGSRGGAVAAVTHLAILKICFLIFMNLEFDSFWKLDLDNGSVSLFTHDEESGFALRFWNRAPQIGVS